MFRNSPLSSPQEEEWYYEVVEQFQQWCELKQSPFKVEAAAAMKAWMKNTSLTCEPDLEPGGASLPGVK